MLPLLALVVAMSAASCGISAFSVARNNKSSDNRQSSFLLSAEQVNRRSAFASAGATVLLPAFAANALNTIPADNEIVKEQRTVVDKLDINNAPVADYMQFPGMYPTIGGKIANNGPYTKVSDLYRLDNSLLSAAEKSKIKEYEKEFTATASTGLDVMRGRDPYRRSFNK